MHGLHNIVFTTLASIGAFLVAIPLPKALASGNVGTSMLIIWTELACLSQVANAIRWNGNVTNWTPVWCDFSTYFFIVVDVALVACSLSINRRLYMIVTLDPRRDQKVFNAIVDIAICILLPWLSIALEYVVQQYRFYIYEDIGCVAGVGNVNLAFLLVWMPPLFIGTVSAGYACFTIRANLRWNHRPMGEVGVSLTWSRRLMALAVISAMYGVIPTSISIVLLAIGYPVMPWPGWTALHSTIHDIAYVSAQEWQSTSTRMAGAELRRWTTVTLGFMIFILLGLTADVKKMYVTLFKSVFDSLSQASSRSIFEKNVDGGLGDQKAPRSSHSSHFSRDYYPSFGTSRSGSREGVELAERPSMDLSLEGFQMVLPISRPDPDATCSMDPSWKVYPDEEDGRSVSHV